MTQKQTIWIMALEPLENRYTSQWFEHVPKQLALAAGSRANVVQVSGIQKSHSTTKGAFLDFADTNRWKSTQLIQFIDYMDEGKVSPNDIFLFTDAWNPTILQIKYMNDLMGFNWKIHSIFHAGAYDPSDILGYKMSKPWPWDLERSIYFASDSNWFATHFHRDMFLTNLDIPKPDYSRSHVGGQPQYGALEQINNFKNNLTSQPTKTVEVIWPHRYNDDKQPDIAEDLNLSMNDSWIITQKHKFSKAEYYQKLSESKVIFSCSLHENLGLGIAEAVLLGAIPVLPSRCCYSEIYSPEFIYPSEWTQDWNSYQANKQEMLEFIGDRINNPQKYQSALELQQKKLIDQYLTSSKMFEHMLQDIV